MAAFNHLGYPDDDIGLLDGGLIYAGRPANQSGRLAAVLAWASGLSKSRGGVEPRHPKIIVLPPRETTPQIGYRIPKFQESGSLKA